MVAELGQFALILALCMALVQAVMPLLGAEKGDVSWMQVGSSAARAQFGFITIAFACLVYSFVVHDFSVAYVAHNSNSQLPLLYRVSAVWGAHEGSLLLWAYSLSIWTLLVTVFNRNIPLIMQARVLAVLGLLSIGFLLFMLLTSNPFDRLFPIPAEGRDLNPLLQDPGLAFHPPMLYMGYVGFSIAFAFAIAAMLGGKLDAAWARWARPWTNVAWMFLTLGIALGSWWAYYELGWGGWWFWDPVENASFLPWLVGTALIHSLAVTEKRGIFKAWTVLLAIFAFSLSLLGTFLVRSGVLTSVHAFATDPERGVFILMFLVLVIGGSLLLYGVRASQLKNENRFSAISKETLLLMNNIILVVVACSVLLGTLYPLLLDALGVGKISVGPPYFNSVFVPLTLPLLVLMGIGMMLRWKSDQIVRYKKTLLTAMVVSLLAGLLLPWAMYQNFSLLTALGVAAAVWVITTTLHEVYLRVAHKPKPWRALLTIPRGFYGMTLAHLGVAVFTIGVTLTSTYSLEKDVRLAPGESLELAGYRFQFNGVRAVRGPNYQAQQGQIQVHKDGEFIAHLEPQKRSYQTQPNNSMTEAAIDDGLFRDLFVALGEARGEEGAWTLRIYYKPFIRWIWLGCLFMGLGGLLAATDRRYRVAVKAAKLSTKDIQQGSAA